MIVIGSSELMREIHSSTAWSVSHVVLIFLSHTQQKNDKNLELIEVPVKDLTYDQLQLLKVIMLFKLNLSVMIVSA